MTIQPKNVTKILHAFSSRPNKITPCNYAFKYTLITPYLYHNHTTTLFKLNYTILQLFFNQIILPTSYYNHPIHYFYTFVYVRLNRTKTLLPKYSTGFLAMIKDKIYNYKSTFLKNSFK